MEVLDQYMVDKIQHQKDRTKETFDAGDIALQDAITSFGDPEAMIKGMIEQGVNPIDLRQELEGIDREMRMIKEQKSRLVALSHEEFIMMVTDDSLRTNVLEKVE